MDETFMREQRIREFQSNIDTPEFNGVIAALLTEQLAAPELAIAFDYTAQTSRHETRSDGKCYIFIRTNVAPGEGQYLLFDLLHELGHYHDADALPLDQRHNRDLQQRREQRAWEWADIKFKQYPELAAGWDAYQAYRKSVSTPTASGRELRPGSIGRAA